MDYEVNPVTVYYHKFPVSIKILKVCICAEVLKSNLSTSLGHLSQQKDEHKPEILIWSHQHTDPYYRYHLPSVGPI